MAELEISPWNLIGSPDVSDGISQARWQASKLRCAPKPAECEGVPPPSPDPLYIMGLNVDTAKVLKVGYLIVCPEETNWQCYGKLRDE